MTEPTADELARWAELAEQATPGPWGQATSTSAYLMCPGCEHGNYVARAMDNGHYEHRHELLIDARFIAAARTAVPRLLALVAAQAEQVADGERERRAAGVRFEKSLTGQDAKLQQALKVLREARTEVDRLTHAVSEKYYRGAEMIDAAHERTRAAEAKLARVRTLHSQSAGETYGGWCAYCGESWPCQTSVALDGTEATP